MKSEGPNLSWELLRAEVTSLLWALKEKSLAQLPWSFFLIFCFPGNLPGWVSLKRPSPGENQIIEAGDYCPNDVSLLKKL